MCGAEGASSQPSSVFTSLSLIKAVMEDRQGSMLSCHGSSSSSKLSKNLFRILRKQEAEQELVSPLLSPSSWQQSAPEDGELDNPLRSVLLHQADQILVCVPTVSHLIKHANKQ